MLVDYYGTSVRLFLCYFSSFILIKLRSFIKLMSVEVLPISGKQTHHNDEVGYNDI